MPAPVSVLVPLLAPAPVSVLVLLLAPAPVSVLVLPATASSARRHSL